MYMAAGFPWVDKTRRRSYHRRNNSSELDIFEAEHYFSTENSVQHRSTSLSQKLAMGTKEDMPMTQNMTLSSSSSHEPSKDNKKHKPSSPGAKLASFFNSLINQAVSKKKKASKSSPQSIQDVVEDESPSPSPSGWRRRRRSSISHFRSSTASSFSSAFASQKPNTPSSSRAKRTSMSDVDSRSVASIPRSNKNNNKNNIYIAKKNGDANLDWLDEKFKQSSKGLEKRSKEFKRFEEADGAESDSSSDLFELKLNYDHDHHHNHHLGYCGGGLPVYETTHMDSIKISSASTPIINGPFRNS